MKLDCECEDTCKVWRPKLKIINHFIVFFALCLPKGQPLGCVTTGIKY